MAYRDTPARVVGTRKSDKEEVNLTNCKPFRTKIMKAVAGINARKDKDGTYRSSAPVFYHQEYKA